MAHAPSEAPRTIPPALLPVGMQWRHAVEQLAMRLGAFPGDRVAIVAPPRHDPAPHLVRRLPRLRWVQLGDDARFGWDVGPPAGAVVRLRADVLTPPFPPDSIAALVTVFTVPVLSAVEHTAFVAAWRDVLGWYGKWLSLVASSGPGDARLVAAERDLRRHGFTRVRAQRLALGRMGAQLVLLSARRGDAEDEPEPDGEDDDEE